VRDCGRKASHRSLICKDSNQFLGIGVFVNYRIFVFLMFSLAMGLETDVLFGITCPECGFEYNRKHDEELLAAIGIKEEELKETNKENRAKAKKYLLDACKKGNPCLVSALLEVGEYGYHYFDSTFCYRAADLAAKKGHVKILKLFAKHGWCLWGYSRYIPLLTAAKNGQLVVVKFLLEYIPPHEKRRFINGGNQQGQTALHLAEMNGHKQVANLLRQHGASDTAFDDNEKRPRDYAQWFAPRKPSPKPSTSYEEETSVGTVAATAFALAAVVAGGALAGEVLAG
jgi:hypothetical protein